MKDEWFFIQSMKRNRRDREIKELKTRATEKQTYYNKTTNQQLKENKMANFFKSHTSTTINGTSNIMHLADRRTQEYILQHVTPDKMYDYFGEGDDACLCESHKGYTDPEWYFKGPGDVVLGIGFRYGQPRLRGKNLQNQFAKPQEICETFVNFINTKIAEEQ